jgi:hypothetical protein
VSEFCRNHDSRRQRSETHCTKRFFTAALDGRGREVAPHRRRNAGAASGGDGGCVACRHWPHSDVKPRPLATRLIQEFDHSAKQLPVRCVIYD